MSLSLHRRWAAPAVAALWLLAIAGGWYWMTSSGFQAGKSGHASAKNFTLPVESLIAGDGLTLLVALHPECSCSVATVEELERISRQSTGHLKIVAVFANYDSLPRKIEESKLWKSANAIPGVLALADRDGKIRAGFGAMTSGDCLLTDRAGSVLYRGGITSSRGHSGASAGGDAIISLTLGERPNLKSAPVFGCALDRQVSR